MYSPNTSRMAAQTFAMESMVLYASSLVDRDKHADERYEEQSATAFLEEAPVLNKGSVARIVPLVAIAADAHILRVRVTRITGRISGITRLDAGIGRRQIFHGFNLSDFWLLLHPGLLLHPALSAA